VPLVIVNVLPEFEHAPLLENVTTPPGALAATPKLVPNAALAGACDDTEITCAAFAADTDSTTCGAALKSEPPAWSYCTEHVPIPLVIVNVAPTFEHEPALENATGPPGAVAATEKLVPNAALAGACDVTVITWLALAGVTAFDSADCAPVPIPFTAATVNV
jgi:hypothetical protein